MAVPNSQRRPAVSKSAVAFRKSRRRGFAPAVQLGVTGASKWRRRLALLVDGSIADRNFVARYGDWRAPAKGSGERAAQDAG